MSPLGVECLAVEPGADEGEAAFVIVAEEGGDGGADGLAQRLRGGEEPCGPPVFAATRKPPLSLNPAQGSDSVGALNPSNAGITSVPASVTIQAGQMTASFPVGGVSPGSATVTAAFMDSTATANVSVEARPAPGLSLSPASQTIQAGQAGALSVTLSAAQDSDTAISLNSSNPGVAGVPGVVIIPRGATSVPVPLTANAAGTAGFVARLPAALGGSGTKAAVNVIE